MKNILAVVVVLGFLAARPAGAIPPPWQLEEMKAKADVIAICSVSKVESVKQDRYNGKATMNVVQAIRAPGGTSTAPKEVQVFFTKLEKDSDASGISKQVAGGTGFPEPRAGETALVFLAKRETGGFTIICGTWGYAALRTDTDEARKKTIERLAQYREWSKKISEPRLAAVMEDSYRQTLEFIQPKPR